MNLSSVKSFCCLLNSKIGHSTRLTRVKTSCTEVLWNRNFPIRTKCCRVEVIKDTRSELSRKLLMIQLWTYIFSDFYPCIYPEFLILPILNGMKTLQDAEGCSLQRLADINLWNNTVPAVHAWEGLLSADPSRPADSSSDKLQFHIALKMDW